MPQLLDIEVARRLQERLLERQPEWGGQLRLDTAAAGAPLLRLELPHRPDHELSVEVRRTEATVAYSDGVPPGPAETCLVWGDVPPEEGLEAVCEYVTALVRGDLILVRERLSALLRLLRRWDCDSLLWLVPVAELESWPPRRRRRVLRAWSWEGASKLVD